MFPKFRHCPFSGWIAAGNPARPPKKHPNALSAVDRTPGTFSHTNTVSGFPRRRRCSSIAFAILMYSMVRFPLSSFSDSRSPATLKAWHGVPAMKTSGASSSSFAIRSASVRKSPAFGVSGQRYFSTAHGKGSISEHHRHFQPSRSCHAISGAPMPEHPVAKVISLVSISVQTLPAPQGCRMN